MAGMEERLLTPPTVPQLEIRPSPRILFGDWSERLLAAPYIAVLAVTLLLIYGAARDPKLTGWL